MRAKELWELYTNDKNLSDTKYDVWYFGDTEELANELLKLVLAGEKTATTGAAIFYDEEPLPKVGDYSIITNFKGEPYCIIKTTKVYQEKFCNVSEEHALKEGEGDKTYQYWRDAHIT